MINDRNHVTVQRVIPAPPEPIFDLLADPAGHLEIDGSGTVKASRSGSRRLALGDSFGMDMQMGASYSTRNVVVEFEDNRVIAWQTLAPGLLRHLLTGRIWRYQLTPVEGGTLVSETWDITQEALPSRLLIRMTLADKTRSNMERTLARIEELVTAKG